MILLGLNFSFQEGDRSQGLPVPLEGRSGDVGTLSNAAHLSLSLWSGVSGHGDLFLAQEVHVSDDRGHCMVTSFPDLCQVPSREFDGSVGSESLGRY